MKRRSTMILSVFALAAVATTAAMVAKPAEAPDGAAAAVAVARGDLVDKALAVGTIEPEVEVSVKSKVSGVVRRLFAEEGDFVQAGAPLLEIRPDPTPLELVEARRQLELRGIELQNHQRELGRREALLQRGLLSQEEFQTSERGYQEAVLQQKIARERLQLLEEGRIRGPGTGVESVVRAPVSGYLLEKMVEVGDPVVPLSTYQEGTVLMTMADMAQLIFRGTVDEIDVGRLKEGMPVEIKVGALPNASIQGVVRRISLKAKKDADANATTFPVEIALSGTDGATLRAGLSANAEIIIQKREQVLLIPERVVTFEGDSAWVMVERSGAEPQKRAIRTGLSDALQVEVLSGLKPGERVLEKPAKKVE